MYSTKKRIEIKFSLWESDVPKQYLQSLVVEDVRQSILMITFEIRKRKKWEKKRQATFLATRYMRFENKFSVLVLKPKR